jgi:hypothetical protein
MVHIHPSARKHGVPDADIEHAIRFAVIVADTEEDPDKVLYLGPDRAGNLLEVVALARIDEPDLVIHAMAMRPRYHGLLQETRERDG